MSKSKAWGTFWLLVIVVYFVVQLFPKPTTRATTNPAPIETPLCPSKVLESTRLEMLSPVRSHILRMRIEGAPKTIAVDWAGSSISAQAAQVCQSNICSVALPSNAPDTLEVRLDDCKAVNP